ncbi:hypothetical protein KTO58_16270 [Chitinophaga pendula]|uniref:hypothetical protein n=1 Tax=Chitinophaga TaxID=79328 RepID=UPI000BB0B61C|nr:MULTISPECIES: hypothetical protein [Chitinophaga]ASZ11732.1 hypothetical protein CK934_12575 [Chitinophaga sp. MD30]UCJ05248.1 hypothetical protein KTO58_16270 [Chitinophaga pendula]
MEELTLGIGSRVQHARYGPGVIIGVKYAQYTVTFMNEGILDVDKDDPLFEVLYAENKTVEVETLSAVETSLLKILRLWGGVTEKVPIGERWEGGTLVLQPKDSGTKAKEIPLDVFFHKIVMVRDRLRVLEQQVNSHKQLSDADKVNMQQYITRIYGSLTTFNVLFKEKEHWFVGEKGGKED